ncbi:hypothetical protein THAOC_31223 [Thalassiosira oceanica]|uniref:DUF4209 domain-containing protein n=1 Tax=Thalassiosira oceanica TaxID=159749 RepID=K0RLQ2_THAOC|nr:hypothetical protein THAOC_31223 [Thalassiosira oceanica]|eukprot:EJK49856.1 hypothetical protein THAOC_31223 [Thalassiosira oceanica]
MCSSSPRQQDPKRSREASNLRSIFESTYGIFATRGGDRRRGRDGGTTGIHNDATLSFPPPHRTAPTLAYAEPNAGRHPVEGRDDAEADCRSRVDLSLLTNAHTSMKGYEETVHPDISRMLLAEYDTTAEVPYYVTGRLTLGCKAATMLPPDSLRIDQLANLAEECERAISRSSTSKSMSPTQLGLIRLSESECGDNDGTSLLVASMMALTLLESSIRRTVNWGQPAKQGSAPLKDLIQRLSEMEVEGSSLTSLAPVLRTLLLPTKFGGINLRNLVLHGFLSEISVKWFSLVLILLNTFEDAVPAIGSPESNGVVFPARPTKYPFWKDLVENGQSILRSKLALQKLECQARDFVPTTHLGLLRFLLRNLAPTIFGESSRPLSVTYVALMCIILEHSLRLMWCEINGRLDDKKAQPSTYYVTLDGHGQKTIHDVILLPFLMTGERNALVQELGAPLCSLLSDLFTSPSLEAPNTRAAVFHGTFDETIFSELKSLVEPDVYASAAIDERESNESLADIACVLTSCLESLSNPSRALKYRPVYSHTASYNRQFAAIFANLNRLRAIIANDRLVSDAVCLMEERQAQICHDATALYVDPTDLQVMNEMLAGNNDDTWGVEDLYDEHSTNLLLSSSGASLALLEDTAAAAESYIAGLNERTIAVERGARDRVNNGRAAPRQGLVESCREVKNDTLNFRCIRKHQLGQIPEGSTKLPSREGD